MARQRITRLVMEAVAAAPQEVSPKALPDPIPFVFPANWISVVKNTTSWQTDIATADTLSEERRSLVTRPTRTIRASLLRFDREEAHALEVAIAKHGSQESPVPIYSDVTYLTGSTVDLGGGKRHLPCDTTFRRFNIGQRVAVVHPLHRAVVSADNIRYGLIKEISTDSLTLTEEGPNWNAELPADSVVYPLLDAEVNLRSDLTHLTDDKLQASVSFQEVAGNNTLPPLWRGPLSSLFPTASKDDSGADYLPVFNLTADWKKGIKTEIMRKGRRTSSGKSSILNPQGNRSLYKHTLNMLELNREDAWRVLRFFDFHRGRAKPFWFPNPQYRAWTFISKLVGGSSELVIQAGGQEKEILDFDHVYQRFGNTYEIRPIGSVTQVGNNFTIVPPLNHNFINPVDPDEVGPCHLVRFTKDSIEEVWTTNQTMSTKFELEDILLETDQTGHQITSPSSSHGDPDTVADLDFWFSSNRNIYTVDSISSVATRSHTWPSINHEAAFIFDVRENLDNVMLENAPKKFLFDISGGNAAALVRSQTDWMNKGQRTILNGSYFFSHHAPPGDSFHIPWLTTKDKALWSTDDGWTIFICLLGDQTIPTVGVPARGLRVLTTDQSPDKPLLDWLFWGNSADGEGEITFYSAPGTVITTLPHARTAQKVPLIIAMRWTPGAGASVWFNGASTAFSGNPWNKSFTQILGIPSEAENYRYAGWCEVADKNKAVTSSIVDTNYNKDHFFNEIINYKRALPASEMDIVGNYLSDLYGIEWVDVSGP